MDEFKPEDELKPDPSDRRTGRTRQSSERDKEPQINFDEVDLDNDDPRPSRGRAARDEREEEDYESEDDSMDEEPVERRPRKRKAAAAKPASRQYIMMGLGVLVLLLLIIGVGSALKAPSTTPADQTASGEKSIDLSGSAADQANGSQPAPGTTSAENTQQEISLPPVASTPTQGQSPATPEGQQRVEVQGDLNNALTQPQNQQQVNNVVVNSTLPTEPATVAPIRGASGQQQTAAAESAPRQTKPAQHQERKQTVIEPKREAKPQPVAKAEAPKAVAQPKHTETAASAPVKAPAATATAPKATATASTPAATAPAASSTGKSTGNVSSLKSAPSNNYTLQLSSSSNYDNLNGWAKKSNLKNFVVYETTRNGQPWYVLVSGVYASKDDAKRAVATLPADVQAKNPWAKPIRQVQSDLK
ncbi:cell division protein DamX [Leclercia adecarboxylata]|uniref:cell division protein DamX n=1 Tax=Leclercia adecarboxylata TaxID=83655 RepID=UPI002DBA8F00|nr:cell division protein DamX [Leclercia adecarboxylata]MEB6381232.1 cell division protein DamX [Leclercia adecarboxylata]